MLSEIRSGLTAAGQYVLINVQGQAFSGINLTGTWAGTAVPEITFDGVRWASLGTGPTGVALYPGGTANPPVTAFVSTSGTNLNGFYYANLPSDVSSPLVAPLAVRVRMSTYVSGTLNVGLSASVDNSFIDISLADTTINQAQQGAAATANTITVAANNNHGWKLKALVITSNGTAAATALVQVKSGANVVAQYDIPINTSGGPLLPPILIPPDGIKVSAGNALVVTVASFGSGIKSTINANVGCC